MNAPVLIAGAGPVGLMLACETALAGVDTVVLERLAEPSGRSRGMAINGTVVELLAQRGLMDSLRGDGFEFPLAHFAHIFLDPARVPGRHAFNFAVPHSQVQRRLAERAAELGVEIRRGVEVIGLTQDENGVQVQVRTESGTETVAGSYLVGCDGTASVVRELAGIAFPGTDSPFRGFIGDVDVEPGSPMFERLGVNQYETGIGTVAPVGPQTLRVVTGEFEVAPADPEAPASVEELREAFERITGTAFSGTPVWLERWTDSTRQAERYRAGRVFVAGDAAHVHFPLGGQALSTGIEDAVNLGWKLAAAVLGHAPDGLLDSYHDERHPVGARACLTSRAQTALMHPMARISPLREVFADLVRFDEVNTYLVELGGAFDVRYDLAGAEHSALVGSRFGDVPLVAADTDTDADDAQTSLAKLLGTGRGLLLDLTSGASEAMLRETAAGWSDRVDTVAVAPSEEIAAAAVLLRPDGRVAWASAEAGTEGLADALAAWFGKPDMG